MSRSFMQLNIYRKSMLLLSIMLFILNLNLVNAQDSLYFYQSGKIVYSESIVHIDSLTFLPENYYNQIRSNIVMTQLESDPETLTFARMIRVAGLQNDIDGKTIWTPLSNSLNNINLQDTINVRKIVFNHISDGIFSTNIQYDSLYVQMWNGKHYLFKKGSSQIAIDTITVKTPNIYSAKTIIHKIEKDIPYKKNIWEFLTEDQGHDSLKQFLNSYNITSIDQTSGDTVITNDILKQFPFLSDEFENYTVTVPNDHAWNEAYDKLYTKCEALIDTTSQARKEITQLEIFKNLFYKGNPDFTRSDTTFITIFGGKLNPSSTGFQDAVLNPLSNGRSYTINSLDVFNDDIYSKTTIEMENYNIFRTVSYFQFSIQTNTDSNLIVSNNRYVSLTPTTTSDLAGINSMYIRIPIQGIIANKYNIYCVFVPSTKPSKVRFFLSYENSKGTMLNNQPMDVNNDIIFSNLIESQKITQANIFVTDASKMDKMLIVKNFQFPFSSFKYNNTSNNFEPTVYLRINNAAKTSETAFTKSLGIDCIIIERVNE